MPSFSTASFLAILLITRVKMDMCSREDYDEFPYFAKNVSEQNCGCSSCIRRCCKPGYTYSQRYCHANSNDTLLVPVYRNKLILVDTLFEIENFVVGVPDCVMFRLDYPDEEFFIQNEGKDVWVPMYNQFYNNSRYCVDEMNGFTPFLCFSSLTRGTEGQTVHESNTLGKKRCFVVVFMDSFLSLEQFACVYKRI